MGPSCLSPRIYQLTVTEMNEDSETKISPLNPINRLLMDWSLSYLTHPKMTEMLHAHFIEQTNKFVRFHGDKVYHGIMVNT